MSLEPDPDERRDAALCDGIGRLPARRTLVELRAEREQRARASQVEVRSAARAIDERLSVRVLAAIRATPPGVRSYAHWISAGGTPLTYAVGVGPLLTHGLVRERVHRDGTRDHAPVATAPTQRDVDVATERLRHAQRSWDAVGATLLGEVCCAQGVVRYDCTCSYRTECPVHGEICHGSHE